jgi:hypothetical protein
VVEIGWSPLNAIGIPWEDRFPFRETRDDSVNKLKPGSGSSQSRGCGVLFGLFFISTAVPGLIVSIKTLLADPESDRLSYGASTLCTSLFLVIGLIIIGASVIPWIAELRMGKPEISISSGSVRVGDGFSVNFSQTFKKQADVKGIRMALVKQERATYSDGSNFTTVTHEETAAEVAFPARVYEAGELLTFSRGMQIPHDGMHTFHAKYNAIAWLLQVKVDIAGWPDYRQDLEIQVLPGRAV